MISFLDNNIKSWGYIFVVFSVQPFSMNKFYSQKFICVATSAVRWLQKNNKRKLLEFVLREAKLFLKISYKNGSKNLFETQPYKKSVFAFMRWGGGGSARHLMARNETRSKHKSPVRRTSATILPEKDVVDLFADEGAQTEELAIDTVQHRL